MYFMPDLQRLSDEDFCYLTTTGRISGHPHTIEIWFALHGQTIYMLSGGRERADWVKNARIHPNVQVRISDSVFAGTAYIVDQPEEDTLARTLVFEKYTPRDEDDLKNWARTSLPVAVALQV
jgi:deazaflavin-dependent oxidoreductase (nitroreductase family)